MNLYDIKNILNNESLIKEINLNYNYPSRMLCNTIIINKILSKYPQFTKSEIIYLLQHKDELENLHIFCSVCGKKNVFNNIKYGYSLYCCANHASNGSREKAKQTWLKKYGVDNPNKCRKVREKLEQTNLRKYGVKYNWASKDPKLNGRSTRLKKYGVENCFASKDFKLNGRESTYKKYGVYYIGQTQEYKDLYKNKEWVKNNVKKQYESKKKNGTLNSSKIEQICFEKLKNIFIDTVHNYRDVRYPFDCDFYIPSKDLFIELNFHWTHGNVPFDKNNEDHIRKLEEWKRKSKEINFKEQTKKFYKNAIQTWTIRDVKKLKTFQYNNLNYKIFYKEEDFNKWLLTSKY